MDKQIDIHLLFFLIHISKRVVSPALTVLSLQMAWTSWMNYILSKVDMNVGGGTLSFGPSGLRIRHLSASIQWAVCGRKSLLIGTKAAHS